jgi:hypothetical protein
MIDIVVRSRRRQGVEVVLHNLLQEVLNISSINLLNIVTEEENSAYCTCTVQVHIYIH